jgi:hypothetical protein
MNSPHDKVVPGSGRRMLLVAMQAVEAALNPVIITLGRDDGPDDQLLVVTYGPVDKKSLCSLLTDCCAELCEEKGG